MGIKQLGQGICSIIQDLKANLGKVKGLKFGQDQVLGERRKSALESKRSSPGEVQRNHPLHGQGFIVHNRVHLLMVLIYRFRLVEELSSYTQMS